ncbi:MAG: hypothetical protein OXG85_09180 [Chloroflexi bacterium]|nr:hypothetical protein [Chloroflexota bacterium]
MRKELPRFRNVQRRYAAAIIHDALSGPAGSALLKLTQFDDHHFRAIFDSKFFQLPAGEELPSKSQWNTLKKRLKRRDRSIFVFREYGPIDCGELAKPRSAGNCLYLDFGFLSQ